MIEHSDSIHPFEAKHSLILYLCQCAFVYSLLSGKKPHQVFPLLLRDKQRSHVVKQRPLRQCNVVSAVMPLMPSYATPPLLTGFSDSDKGDRSGVLSVCSCSNRII